MDHIFLVTLDSLSFAQAKFKESRVYFKSYNKAIEDVKTKVLTDNTSVVLYGILRCCVFTENMTLDPVEFIKPDVDTLYYNEEYIVKHLTNQLPLTYHYLKI